MSLVTKTVEVEASSERVRKDTGTVTPGWPAYSYQEISKYEGEPKQLVVEVLSVDFKGRLEAFNDFLIEAVNRKRRIDSRPGMDPVTKQIAKLAKETGKTSEEIRKLLGL